MPQMAPLLWTILYIFFVLTFLCMLTVHFFTKSPQKMSATYKKSQTPTWQWKW